MSREIETILEAAPAEAPPEPSPAERHLRWFELALVLLVAVGLSFLNSLTILRSGPGVPPNQQNSKWTNGIFHEVTALMLLGYVLARRGRRIRDLGLRWSLRDAAMGLPVAIASYVAYAMGYSFLHSLHNTFFASSPRGPTPAELFGHLSIMAIPFSLLNPFFEELIVRAYLMTEVKDLTGSWKLAAGLSVAVQTSYHIYYGWEGALSLAFQFLVFSIYYARAQKATPIIVAHGIFDIIGMMRLA